MRWIDFRYREFWDIPRSIIIQLPKALLLLESRFDDTIDDYDEYYTIFRLPPGADLAGSWANLAEAALEQLGKIRVRDVVFDPTKRRQLDLDGLRHVLPEDILRTQLAGRRE